MAGKSKIIGTIPTGTSLDHRTYPRRHRRHLQHVGACEWPDGRATSRHRGTIHFFLGRFFGRFLGMSFIGFGSTFRDPQAQLQNGVTLGWCLDDEWFSRIEICLSYEKQYNNKTFYSLKVSEKASDHPLLGLIELHDWI
jgi:hypothetical protein